MWRWLLLLFIGLVIVAIFSYHALFESITFNDADQDLETTARQKADQLGQWRSERLGDADRSANSPFLQYALQQYRTDPASASLQRAWHKRLHLESVNYGYSNTLLLDKRGRVELADKDKPFGQGPVLDRAIAHAVATRDTTLSEVHMTDDGDVVIDAIAPILNDDGELLGFLVLRSDLMALLGSTFGRHSQHPPVTTTLYRQTGSNVVQVSDPALPVTRPGKSPQCAANLSAALANSIECESATGVTMRLGAARVPNSDWVIAQSASAADIRAEAHRRTAIGTGITSAILAAFLFAVGIIATRREAKLTSQLNEAEAELRSLSRMQEKALESLGEAVLIIEPRDVTIVTCNSAASRIFGYDSEEMIGQSAAMLHINEAHFHQFNARSEEMLDRDMPFTGEYVMKRKDGTVFATEHVIAALDPEAGWRAGVVSIVRDISERKQAEADKERLHGQLLQAQKLEATGRLAGGIAHDFNNMLGIILGYTDSLLEVVDDQPSLCEDLQEIRAAAQRCATLTRQLLGFARQQHISPATFSLNQVIPESIQTLERLLDGNIDVEWMPGEDLWNTVLDKGQLEQILFNLVINARDAIDTDSSGRIGISTANVSVDEAFCREHSDCYPGNFVRLSIADNGKGMDETALAKLFDPFFTTKPVGKGTGLGMATVYGILKQNNGAIEVRSEPGSGTVCDVYLPRAPELARQPDAHPPAKPGGETGNTGAHILIVEDQQALLSLTTRVLARAGFTVTSCDNPQDAIEAIRDNDDPLALVLTDIVMPNMNGQVLWQEINALRPQARCIFMSGFSDTDIFELDTLGDEVQFLQKPFTPSVLLEHVNRALGTSPNGPATV